MGEHLSCTLGDSGLCATAISILKMLNSLNVPNRGQVQSQKASRPGFRNVSDQDSFTVISSKRKNKGSFWGKLRCYFVANKGSFPRDESQCSWLKWTLKQLWMHFWWEQGFYWKWIFKNRMSIYSLYCVKFIIEKIKLGAGE